MAETVWNEKTTRIVEVSFFDEDHLPCVPSAGTYRLDTARGVSIKAQTNLPSLASVVPIVVTAAENAILATGAASEVHKMTVEFDYGSAPVKHGTAEYVFTIIGLQGVL
jgi:hypothetical protein